MKRRIIRKLIATVICMIMLGNMGLVTAYEAVEGYEIEAKKQQMSLYQFYQSIQEYMQFQLFHGSHELRTRETLEKLINLNYDKIRYEINFVENTVAISDNENSYISFLIEDEDFINELFEHHKTIIQPEKLQRIDPWTQHSIKLVLLTVTITTTIEMFIKGIIEKIKPDGTKVTEKTTEEHITKQQQSVYLEIHVHINVKTGETREEHGDTFTEVEIIDQEIITYTEYFESPPDPIYDPVPWYPDYRNIIEMNVAN